MKISLLCRLFLSILLGLTSIAHAEPSELNVLTIERQPFVIKKENGAITGFSIELWHEIAQRNGYKYQVQLEDQFPVMLDKVANNQADLAIANISITSEREEVMDFSQPIYDSGLQILLSEKATGFSVWKMIWKSGIISLFFYAFVILLIVAHLMWFFERGGHHYFRKEYVGGIWDAFWWAFIIVTMGGFERERPERVMGRVFAVMWIVAGLFFISYFTAKITTFLTVNELTSGISSYKDLSDKKIGIATGTTMSAFADKKDIKYTPYSDFQLVLKDLEKGKIDATIGEAATSQYHATHKGKDKVMTTGEVFAPDKLGIAYPSDSALQEEVDRTLLKIKEDGTYEALLEKYFGD